MKLTNVTIKKYKSIETDQEFTIENDVTVLVGMNESGKTSVLEALAKTHYFQPDDNFKFTTTHDYPRREKKSMDKSGKNPVAIECTYALTGELHDRIVADVGPDVFGNVHFTVSTNYSNGRSFPGVSADQKQFIENKTKALRIHSNTLTEKLLPVTTLAELEAVIQEYTDKRAGLETLKPYYENKWSWACPIGEYIVRTILDPALPKFLYYDEYYSLPSRISIEDLNASQLEEKSLKTARALFELADINVDELIKSEDFEDFVAELEATEATITDELFKYWSTNTNLDITFRIDKKEATDPRNNNRHIVEHILDIRVKNTRNRVSLPLRNRSKGFNWFFSFLVWFKKIQEDKDSNYILLLDEPGLNLHASAQADLLRFIYDLSDQYQIVYTTHSPFMVQSEHLEKIRTVVETNNGTKISDSVHEKDPKTLFPLQAALGYNIAQNLFISRSNLLVEGISDLVYLQIMSAVLEAEGRTGLDSAITIVPTGGLDKVATFISLMRGNNLQFACLLDSFSNTEGQQKLNNMVKAKLIRQKQIWFAHDFLDGYQRADVEDFFFTDEYVKMFRGGFPEHEAVELDSIGSDSQPIISEINNALGVKRFNHYRPANWLAQQGVSAAFFTPGTLDVFENVFTTLNSLFEE